MNDILLSIESVIGSSTKTSRDERLFNCPFSYHHKPKLSINFGEKLGFWKCWVCDESAKKFSTLLFRLGYSRKEIKDILSYLRLIVNPKDIISLKRIVNFPPRGVGLKTIAKCQKLADKKKIPLFDIFKDLSELDLRNKQVNSLKNFHDLIIKYRDLLDKLSPNEFTRALVEEAGIIQYYKSSELPEDAERLQNARELLNSIDEFVDKGADCDLNNFLIEV